MSTHSSAPLHAHTDLVSTDQRGRIHDNLLTSERQARFAPFHVGAVVLSVLISCGALYVDYAIVTEFWTRALANEFLELPGALATSVVFKSLQVLFATISAHMLIENMSGFGRAIFLRIVFVLALTMLAGLGFQLAMMSLPNGMAEVGAGGVGDSLSGALSQFGLESETTVEEETAQSSISSLMAYQPVFWMASLSVIFLVVTGVAALCLHFAMTALRKLFLARDFKQRTKDMARLAQLEEDYAHARERLAVMAGSDNRKHALWTGLMEECGAYEKGLTEARRSSLLSKPANAAALSGPRWGRGKNNEETAAAPTGPDFSACDASRDVSRYEELFKDWWSKYSSASMGAGPLDGAGARVVTGEILPSLPTPRKAAE